MASPFTYAHWDSTGAFKIAIAGTSHYRAEIELISRNLQDTRSLAICLAYLVLDEQNPHDANAVKVIIGGKLVGYLPAGYAQTYRSYISELPRHVKHVSVAAAITGGLRTQERDYEYTVELDIPDSLKLHVTNEPMDQTVVRANGYAPLQPSIDGTYFVKVWVPTADINELHRSQRVQEWTTDAWETVNYYALNRQGIGLGFKLYELTKQQHATLFGGCRMFTTLILGEGRFATLQFSSSA